MTDVRRKLSDELVDNKTRHLNVLKVHDGGRDILAVWAYVNLHHRRVCESSDESLAETIIAGGIPRTNFVSLFCKKTRQIGRSASLVKLF